MKVNRTQGRIAICCLVSLVAVLALALALVGCVSDSGETSSKQGAGASSSSSVVPLSEKAYSSTRSSSSSVSSSAAQNASSSASATASNRSSTYSSASSSSTASESVFASTSSTGKGADGASESAGFALSDAPAYEGKPSAEVNSGNPFFTPTDIERGAFEDYAPLDTLGRCGAAFALVGRETMPTEERGSIGMIKPSGWKTTRYDWIDGQYLYNRCHLIGYLLTAENDNERNLITGTRSLNTQGMLPYEERVAKYVERTGNHVLYRCTPLFEGDELVARGVLMEALSVEDGGAGIHFCTWCYNVEPGVEIDYATGESHATDGASESSADGAVGAAATAGTAAGVAVGEPEEAAAAGVPEANEEAGEPEAADVQTYVLNTNSHKFHYPWCSSVDDMAEHNKKFVDSTHDEIVSNGYQPCKRCNP